MGVAAHRLSFVAAGQPLRFRAAIVGQLAFPIDWPTLLRPTRPRFLRPAPLIIEQLAITFTFRPVVHIAVTDLMVTVERIVQRLAKSRSEMPTNPVLGELAGGRGRSSVYRALQRLEKIGHLYIEQEPYRRRIVLPDGSATGWGESRPGHSPYCTHARGTIIEPKPIPLIKAAGVQPTRIIMPYEPPKLGRVTECEWPMWADGQRPTWIYCCAPAVRGKSYCVAHAFSSHHETEELNDARDVVPSR